MQRYPAELRFDLPNHFAEYKPSEDPLQPFGGPLSLSLSLKTKSSLGGICSFELGGYLVDLRVQNAKVVLMFKVKSSKVVKLTLASQENLVEGWNKIYLTLTRSSKQDLKVQLDLNGKSQTGEVKEVKGWPLTPSKILFGHLNFKGCMKDLYFCEDVVHESNLVLINVIEGCD